LDSDLNESTKNIGVNSRKEFIYTSNSNMDLRESRRNNCKDSNFTWNPIWKKSWGGGGEFTVFREL